MSVAQDSVSKVAIKSANSWRTNAELIADVASLGYIKQDDVVLDPTYGRGLWWTSIRPKYLVAHDIAINGVDFRRLPYDDGCFDVVAYDPPYVSAGGRDTSTIGEFHNRYGMTDAPKSPAALQDMINDGLTEITRVLKDRGFILCKVQDYVSSGHLWVGSYRTQCHAIDSLGLTQVDVFHHIGSIRAQPKRNRQVHARQNVSMLYVFQKRGRK